MGNQPSKKEPNPLFPAELFVLIQREGDACKRSLKKFLTQYRVEKEDLENIKDEKGNTPLHASVFAQKVEFVDFLLDLGCHARTINFSESPLHTAISLGNLDIVSLLLSKGGGLNLCLSQNDKGETPLHLASKLYGFNPRIFEKVLEFCGSDELNINSSEQMTCLDLLAIHGHYAPLESLLSQGKYDVKINGTGRLGWTPLHYAAKFGVEESCQVLLKYGGALLATNSLGQTPIHVAAMYGHSSCLEVLISACNQMVIVETKDILGNFPLHYALGWRNVNDPDLFSVKIESFEPKPENIMPVHVIKALLDIEVSTVKEENWEYRISILQKNIYGYSAFDLAVDKDIKELLRSYLPKSSSLKTEPLRVQIISDVHTEMLKGGLDSIVKPSGCKYICLLGDIGIISKQTFKDFITIQSKNFEKVFFISGNHEYYNGVVEDVDQELDIFFKELGNVYFLRKGHSYDLEGVRLVGCTLWSFVPEDNKDYIWHHLNDYRRIQTKQDGTTRLINIEDTLRWHMSDRAYIEEEIAKACKNNIPLAIFTHHSPIIDTGCSAPGFWGTKSNSAFSTDLSELYKNVNTWCYGHTHWFHDMYIHGTHIVSNQKGYTGELTYNPSFILEIPKTSKQMKA